jgi:hypothetical protein
MRSVECLVLTAQRSDAPQAATGRKPSFDDISDATCVPILKSGSFPKF